MTARQFFMMRFKQDNPYVSSIDPLSGTGPYCVARYCRRLHIKGEHENWYRHIVFRQHDTLEEARLDINQKCSLDSHRVTDEGPDCLETKHIIYHAVLGDDGWTYEYPPRDEF
jgi:hypothetical protein